MSNPRPARSSSIPIPGNTSRRTIEDMLDFSSLSPPSPAGTSTASQREQSQQRSVAITRSLYSGLEGTRPATAPRHASTSISPTLTRHALGGGSATMWGPRSVSSPIATATSVGLPRLVSGFEPRVIRGNTERAQAAAAGEPAQPSERTQLGHRRDSTSSSRARTRRLSASPSITRSPALSLRPTPTSSSAVPTEGHGTAASASTETTFPKPSYLQHSALRDLIQTAPPPALPPSRYSPNSSISGGGSLQDPPLRREPTPTTDSDEDSESGVSGFGPRFARSRDRERGRGRERERLNTHAHTAPSVLRLPTRWSDQDRNSSLTVSTDGRELHFHGPTSQGEKDAAAARANYSIPPACGIYYYEVEVLSRGQKGHISIGFSVAEVRLTRLPGWEKNSWGYHGDDGNSFASEKKGTPFGPTFAAGDVVGCGIDFSDYKAFYTKNGAFLGSVFENVGKDNAIYPSVGLRTAGEAVRVNFGHVPFAFDIDYHVHCARERTWKRIQAIPVKWTINDQGELFKIEAAKAEINSGEGSGGLDNAPGSTEDIAIKGDADQNISKGTRKEAGDEFIPISLPPDFQAPINKLVVSYLIHHGYERTARAFQMQCRARDRAVQSVGQRSTNHSPSATRQKTLSQWTSGAGNTESDSKIERMETDGTASTTDHTPVGSSNERQRELDDLDQEDAAHDLQARQRIVNAVLAGNIDLVLAETQAGYPSVLERQNGIMLFKLRCRKFVELILEASEALKKVKADAGASNVEHEVYGSAELRIKDLGNAMDVDSENLRPAITNGFANGNAGAIPIQSPQTNLAASHSSPSPAVVKYRSALHDALSYGRRLQSDYKSDTRPEVQSLFKQTFSLVAYDDPAEAGGGVAELAGQDARVRLAQNMNQAILESQGRPSLPALERMYRQSAASLVQLGLMGVGAAAFADMPKEFLE